MQQNAAYGDERVAQCRDVLALWLAWNERYNELAALMYASSEDQPQIERLSDELDSMRFRAVEASRRWLEGSE
jgi:hypothetical protein